jgi:hypothetical protein
MDYFFKSNRVLVWKGSFLKADRVMREIIAKLNHVLFFKVKSRLGLERECMYASCTAPATGTGRR